MARIELLDEEQMRGCIGYSKLEGYRVAPTLFYEFHGTEAGVREQAEQAQAIAQEFGGQDFQWATRAEERNRLWQARHNSYYAALSLRPGAVGWATDVCVPISRLGDCIRETRADLADAGMLAPIVGHVGDGNFHLLMLIDPERPEELATAAEDQQAPGPPRDRDGRDLHRRAWGRLRQDRQPGRGGGPRGRGDGRDQARARSGQHHEPWQDPSRSISRPKWLIAILGRFA